MRRQPFPEARALKATNWQVCARTSHAHMPSPAEIVNTGWVYWISHRDQLLRLERNLRPDILSKARAQSQVTDRRIGTAAHAETEHRSLMQFVSIVTAADIEVVYTARRKARLVSSSNVVSQERRPHSSGYLHPACVLTSDWDSREVPESLSVDAGASTEPFQGAFRVWCSPTHLRRATTVSVSFTLRDPSQLASQASDMRKRPVHRCRATMERSPRKRGYPPPTVSGIRNGATTYRSEPGSA